MVGLLGKYCLIAIGRLVLIICLAISVKGLDWRELNCLMKRKLLLKKRSCLIFSIGEVVRYTISPSKSKLISSCSSCLGNIDLIISPVPGINVEK